MYFTGYKIQFEWRTNEKKHSYFIYNGVIKDWVSEWVSELASEYFNCWDIYPGLIPLSNIPQTRQII